MGSNHCPVCGQRFGLMSLKFKYEGYEICSSCINEYFPYRGDTFIKQENATEMEKKIDKLLASGCSDEEIIPFLNEYKQKLHDFSTDFENAKIREEKAAREKHIREQKAMASETLAKNQKILNGVILTTVDAIEGRKVEEYLGIVMTCIPIGMGFLTSKTGKVAEVLGTESGFLEEKIRKSYLEAQTELVKEAEIRGANAVIGITQSTSNFLTNLTGLVLIGTAVRLAD